MSGSATSKAVFCSVFLRLGSAPCCKKVTFMILLDTLGKDRDDDEDDGLEKPEEASRRRRSSP